jgi:uncharacterized protein
MAVRATTIVPVIHNIIDKHTNVYTDCARGSAPVTDEDFASIRAFEWDENKRHANVIKHGIDFDDAKDVFYDPAAYTFRSAHALSERRYVTVGLMRGALVAAISTRRGHAVRIISARPARRSERQQYGAEIKSETR